MRHICQEKTGVEQPVPWDDGCCLPNSFAIVRGQDLSKEAGNGSLTDWEKDSTKDNIMACGVIMTTQLNLESVGTHLSCCRVSSSSTQWPEILEICAVLWWLPHPGHKQQLKSFMSLFCFPEVASRVFYFHYLAKILSPLRSMLFEYSSLYPLPHNCCSPAHWGFSNCLPIT